MARQISPALREKIVKAYVPGVFGAKSVGKRFGVSATTVRRIVDPDFEERQRRASREAKRRRTGSCMDCGAPTTYNGHDGQGASYFCLRCAAARSGLARRGVGSRVTPVLELLAEGPARYKTIRDTIGMGSEQTSILLLRLLRHGLIVRPERGLYALAEKDA